MVIEKNKVVSIGYDLHEVDENGPHVESTNEGQPFVFLFGASGVIPGFETNLAGLKKGDAFSFGIDCKDAYGTYNPGAIVPLKKSVFEVDGKFDEEVVKVGHSLDMQDTEGQVHRGMIQKVTEEEVTMDFNHPMAGKNLHFKGSVLEVRKATAEELDHGHVHGPGGHHH